MAGHILIVDDDSVILGALTDKFISEGYDVSKATNGQEGLDFCINKTPDLVLLDIIMPIMDGLTMVDRLRDENIKIPVILLTNLSDTEKLSQALQSGSHDYLIKSQYTLSEIVTKVKEKIG